MASGRLSFEQRENKFQQSLAEARSRSDADEALARMLTDSAIEPRHRVYVANSLSNTRGLSGSTALRSACLAALERASNSANKRNISLEYDLIGACAGALASRDGSKAMDIYVAVLDYPNPGLSEYGMSLLARAGDDSAWEKVVSKLEDMLRRPMNPHGLRWSSAVSAIDYLTRHSPTGSERAIRLTTLVRANWRRVPEPDMLEERWPGIGPDGPPPESIAFPQPPRPPRWSPPGPADPDLAARLAELSDDSDIAHW